MKQSPTTRIDSLSALDSLLHIEFEKCWPTDGHRKMSEAQRDNKRRALYVHFESWATCFANVIEAFLPQYARLMHKSLEGDPIGAAVSHLRAWVEREIGKNPVPKTKSPSQDESIEDWLTGHEPPSPRMIWRVADLIGEGANLISSSYDEHGNEISDDVQEVDPERAEIWEGPAWLHLELTVPDKPPPEGEFKLISPMGRLDAQHTRLCVLQLQATIWRKLEEGFHRGRLRTNVDLNIQPYNTGESEVLADNTSLVSPPAMELSPLSEQAGLDIQPQNENEFKLLDEDYSRVRLRGDELRLTETQAVVVRLLHENRQVKGAQSTLTITGINARIQQRKLGRSVKKLEHTFRSFNNKYKKKGIVWKHLIDSPAQGHYRLNVSSPPTDTK